ncbi:MAG: transposase [Rhodomicrobiaceae bacterium]
MTISRDNFNFARRYSVVADTRRQWSDAEKQAIIAEAARPGANISAVARRHGIRPNLLFRWRRLAREGHARRSAAVFVPVTISSPPAAAEAIAPQAAPVPSPDAHSCPPTEATQTDDRIEIELGNGRLVRVGAGIDTSALKRILDVLDRSVPHRKVAGRMQRS